MSYDQALFDWMEEVLAPLGRVTLRRMMGGAILYLDGTVFALLHDDGLWFKADGESDAVWDAEGCARFTVTFKDGRTETMNYRRAPDDVHDDPDAARRWASVAVEAGLRAAAGRGPRRPGRRPGRAALSPPGKTAKWRA